MLSKAWHTNPSAPWAARGLGIQLEIICFRLSVKCKALTCLRVCPSRPAWRWFAAACAENLPPTGDKKSDATASVKRSSIEAETWPADVIIEIASPPGKMFSDVTPRLQPASVLPALPGIQRAPDVLQNGNFLLVVKKGQPWPAMRHGIIHPQVLSFVLRQHIPSHFFLPVRVGKLELKIAGDNPLGKRFRSHPSGHHNVSLPAVHDALVAAPERHNGVGNEFHHLIVEIGEVSDPELIGDPWGI